MSFLIRAAVAAMLSAPMAAMAQAQPDHGAHRAAAPASGARAASASASAAHVGGPSAYRSVFDGHRRYSEQPVQSWREANDAVGRIGGWQAYAREGQGGPVAGSAPTASAPAGHGAMHSQQPPGAPAALAPAASRPGSSPAPAPPLKTSPAPAAPASGAQSGGHPGHK